MTSIFSGQFAAPIDAARKTLAARQAAGVPISPVPVASLDQHQQAVLSAFESALRQWRESPEGSTFVATLNSQDVASIKAHLDAVVQGPMFDETRRLSLGGLLSGWIPKAISIGFAGQIELFVGLYGSLGYIADLSLDNPSSGVYLLGAAAEGIDASLDLSIQGGLWMDAVDDVSGSYKGGELDADEGLGLSGFTLFADDDLKAVLIDLDAGISDGASGLEFHMWTYGIGHDPVAQKPAANMVILELLQCYKTSETGHDEVYLTFTIDGDTATVYRYPTWSYYAMNAGGSEDAWALGRSIWCNSSVDVSIYDHDSSVGVNNADLIGSFSIKVSDFTDTGDDFAKGYSSSSHGANYVLTAYKLDLTA